MKEKIKSILKESARVKERLASDGLVEDIESAARIIISAVKKGGKITVFGNGGSAADAQHMAAELVGRFKKERQAIPAVALTANTSSLTALSNDYGYEVSFSRQLEALGKSGDVAIGISTSGNSRNVMMAMGLAKKIGMRTIALTGKDGGSVKKVADISLVVPSAETARIQEAHIAIIHIICELIEDNL